MKSLTIKYWNTLERSSKERALSMVLGNQHGIINMLFSEKPNKKSPFWKIVFSKVKIADYGHYKTIVNGTYLHKKFTNTQSERCSDYQRIRNWRSE